jgi:uncharacterized membrane protein (DUF485 family)
MTDDKIKQIGRRVKLRFIYSAITMVLYASFILFFTPAWKYFATPLGNSHINLGMIWFIFVILAFLILEYLFIVRDGD